MPYNPTTGIITAPVNSDDVVAAIGIASHNWEDQCSSEWINMWSWAKPIRKDTVDLLHIWKASQADAQSDFAAANFGITVPRSCSPTSMAEHAFTYERVRKGIDPARITDFENYCHIAKPSDYVDDYSKEAFFDTPMGLHFTFEGYFRTTQDGGLIGEGGGTGEGEDAKFYRVNLDSILQKAGISDIVNLYPMVLVETTSQPGAPSVAGTRVAFMHALKCQETGTYRTLGNTAANVKKYYKDWYVDITDLRSLGMYPGSIYRVTVWLNSDLKVPNIDNNTAPANPLLDASTAWREVTGSSYPLIGIAMPLGVGLNIKFSNPSYAAFYFAGIFRNLDNNKAMFQFQGAWTSQATSGEKIYARPVDTNSYWYDNATPTVHNKISWDESRVQSLTVNKSGSASVSMNLYTLIEWATANNKGRTYVVTLGLSTTLNGAIDRGSYTMTIKP